MKHRVKNIHFVGIGGSGMSGIAEVLLNLGYGVSGSDLGSNAATQRLAQLGASIRYGHAAENIEGADAIVTSTAVKGDNPEVLAARKKHIPIVPRAVMLGELMRLKKGIAIAGTHGKTTTTSLVASVLAQGGLDPTFVIGGRLTSAGANAKLGTGEFIVAEADESDASFLNLTPVIEVITNIDADHMETYNHDFARLKQAFVEFTQRLPFYGVAVLCLDDPHVREIMPMVSKPILTYGFHEDADVRAIDAKAVEGKMEFTVIQDGYAPMQVSLNQPGMHNVQNACAAIAIARELDVDDAATQKALTEFNGVGRRFTRYGEVPITDAQGNPAGHFTLVDDYGHHPVETAATIAAARGAYPGRRLVLAFQPHRYTRTRDLFEDFVKVLSSPDVLVLGEVYSAGEAPIVAADGRSLAHALRAAGKVEPVFVDDIGDMPETIRNVVRDGDVVMTMGAGSISAVPGRLVAQAGGKNEQGAA
ncbi:UDP-N-acetylmuramate--L-alanine ligase [Herbaspirillum huttiense F1]|jgi:UDP-N-acetylmuramate--L-alanine ligase (EC 6.3.2.8)|uniref:UDP-N-acetylmuramate--L-alanine ligase n=3 Tax=Herbaspirillum huttiense TaxID=863372 RepID=A0AAJ2LV70_9BURK|nr:MULTISPECIES: UDP-N-acetylmuramate--L-alanine ligase [Herbaspirillum]MBP1314673.1 UDP-N-acetylmuramate--alanine ligase [Herbaspirillum sp. 1130]MCO4858640.1 UDP-N-acetylmuramate--L-alanine ligase [Herbaspirillum sp. WGmk3]MDR6741823.1 UDP-N-acetylmuramate--alanine ligase [Herbaspirillum sp. 1173]MDR9836283.1 UDP-N-acetylmuramate--L-alanine ligase [Herbaspirillum huttiense]MDR9849909.1 UDP-N-acetylmuramate--L-alanine ligase [Herbaspirillum huttiense SE1]